MATVKKHISKNGKTSYYIRVSDGYDCNGKQIERSMTWTPPNNMSEKQIEKELQRQIVKFEDSVKEGQYYDSNIRFGDYGEDWLEMNRPPQLAPKTYECYKGMFRDIKQALGDIKLIKLKACFDYIKTNYLEGVDWTFDAATHTIRPTANTRMPYYTEAEW